LAAVSDSAPAVVVDGVSKAFSLPKERVHTFKERALHPFRSRATDTFTALNGVSFDVRQGEFFGIVGRNGSGKSTLLKCMAGIYKADAGQVLVAGRVSTFIELGVGFNPDLAARDNAILNAIMLGLTRREALERYDRIIEFAGLREFEELKLKNYSSGMLVRLAFSVMIQVDADVLLIDEVLAVGDAAFQQKCHDEFNRLRSEGRTILLVTHDMSTVSRFCDRAMLIEHGNVVGIGGANEIADEYFETNFGRPAPAGASRASGAEPERRRHQGDGTVEIADAWFEDGEGNRVNALPQGRRADFVAVVRFVEAHDDPVFAFSLGTDEDDIVFATSTMWEDERTGSFAAGEQVGFRVAFENHFAPGRYHATPQVARRGSGQDVHVKVKDMASVVVTGARATGGLVDVPHTLRIERAEVHAS
jgi:ABC-type polysaccharide/polyol phosphate transport system ATPase subunit